MKFTKGDSVLINDFGGSPRAATVTDVDENGKLHAVSKEHIFGGSSRIHWTIQPDDVADKVSA